MDWATADWQQIQTYLIGVAAAAIVGLVGRYFGVKTTAEHTAMAQWAIEQGVALATKLIGKKGEEKKAAALETAKSLAPKALAKLDETAKSTLIDATYERMKASLPHPSVYVTHGDALENQTEQAGGKK